MAFEIKLKQDIANEIGKKTIVVENTPLNGEVVTVGDYTTHLSNVLYIKEV